MGDSNSGGGAACAMAVADGVVIDGVCWWRRWGGRLSDLENLNGIGVVHLGHVVGLF